MEICLTNNSAICSNTRWDKEIKFGKYTIFVSRPSKYKHFWSVESNNHIYFVFGNVYRNVDTEFFKNLIKLILNKRYAEAMDLDGEFILGCININTNDILLLSEKEGIIPLYYRVNEREITVTTDERILFRHYSVKDINYQAINDFLRFGCLIGAETMSKSVFKLVGGSILKFSKKNVKVDRIYKFYYQHTSDNIEELMNSVSQVYKKAIQKRIEGKEEDTCIFLSGGLDSRFLLAELNKVLLSRVSTYSFGQPLSEEVNVARACAEVGGNPFTWIKVLPGDFVKHVEEYEAMVCGADMFPQSYIISASKKIAENHFITGYILDACLGGTFLTQEAIDFEGELSEYVHLNQKQLKMSVFTKDELQNLCINEDVAKIFDYDDTGLIKEAKNYVSIPVKDCVQAFVVDNRAKNMVLLREIVPAKIRDCSYVSCDKEFTEAISHISAELRLNHRFYHSLFKREAPEYAKIVYNNTQLPALAPVEQWKEGSKYEVEREKKFEEIIKQYNLSHDDKMYYPHYYSDFNGYSRYDSGWKSLFERFLFSDETIITKILFEKSKLKDLFKEHISGVRNRRKELIYITSLEIFLRTILI